MGGAAQWQKYGPNPPAHGATFMASDVGIDPPTNSYWVLVPGPIVSAKMLGAKGNSDAEGLSGDDDEAILNALLSFTDSLFLPPGFYKVADGFLNGYQSRRRKLWGPGIVVATGNPNFNFYGNMVSAGVKQTSGNLQANGGFLVGGAGPTPEGVMLRTQEEGILDAIPTRPGSPLELQLYTNLNHGTAVIDEGENSPTGVKSRVTTVAISGQFTTLSPPVPPATGNVFTKLVFDNDLVWINRVRYRIQNIDVATQFPPTIPSIVFYLKNSDSSELTVSPVSNNNKVMYWTGYRHHEYIGDYNHTNKTFAWKAGDKFFGGVHGLPLDDPNLIIDGVRYEIESIDEEQRLIVLATGPAASATGVTAVHREWSSEDYCVLFRMQASWAGANEMIVAHFARPDFAGMRVGATDSETQHEYFLDYHFIGESPTIHPDPWGLNAPTNIRDHNVEGEAFTYLTLREGNVGIHEREPIAALHVTRFYDNYSQGPGDHRVPLAAFGAAFYDPDAESEGESTTLTRDEAWLQYGRRLEITARNNWMPPGLQAYSAGTTPLQLCLQPEVGSQSKIHFGDWAIIASQPERFRFTGSVKVTKESGASQADVYAPDLPTTSASANLHVGSGGQFFVSSSSLRYKSNVRSLQDGVASKVLDLRPVEFNSLCSGDDPEQLQIGLVAEEVAAVDPSLVHWREIGEDTQRVPAGIDYGRVVVLLLAEVKKQRSIIDDLERRLAKQ